MPAAVDRVFGVHAEALQLRARRTEVLASNLANADTPNYMTPRTVKVTSSPAMIVSPTFLVSISILVFVLLLNFSS